LPRASTANLWRSASDDKLLGWQVLELGKPRKPVIRSIQIATYHVCTSIPRRRRTLQWHKHNQMVSLTNNPWFSTKNANKTEKTDNFLTNFPKTEVLSAPNDHDVTSVASVVWVTSFAKLTTNHGALFVNGSELYKTMETCRNMWRVFKVIRSNRSKTEIWQIFDVYIEKNTWKRRLIAKLLHCSLWGNGNRCRWI